MGIDCWVFMQILVMGLKLKMFDYLVVGLTPKRKSMGLLITNFFFLVF